MRYLKSLGCISLRTGLLIHFTLATIATFVFLCLILTGVIFSDANTIEVRGVPITKSAATAVIGVSFLINSILLYGLIKEKTALMFPYFVFVTAMITMSLCCGIYLLVCNEKLSALITVLFAFGESKFLYAVVSYYKLIKGYKVSTEKVVVLEEGKVDIKCEKE